MKKYLIKYREIKYRVKHRESYGVEGLISGGEVKDFVCHADSKVEALMALINLDSVFEVLSVERVKDD